MVAPAKIAGMSLAGLGVIGGGIYAFQSFPSKTSNEAQSQNVLDSSSTTNSIANKLSESGYKLLSESSSGFEEILSSYKSIISGKPDLKISDFNGDKTTDKEAKVILLEHCKEITKKSHNESDYKKATKWCVEPITIAKFLEGKVTILKTDDNVGSDKELWTPKITKLKSAKDTIPKIDGIKWTHDTEQIDDKDYGIIKGKCNEIKAVVNHKAEFEDSLTKFKNWCAN